MRLCTAPTFTQNFQSPSSSFQQKITSSHFQGAAPSAFTGLFRSSPYNKRKVAIGETAFFRDEDELAFVKADIEKQLKNKKLPDNKVLVAGFACSYGNENYSLAMLMDELTPKYGAKIDIHGYDIVNRFIKKAQQGTYEILKPYPGIPTSKMDHSQPLTPLTSRLDIDWVKDYYLAFKEESKCTETEKTHKKLFHEFFEEVHYTFVDAFKDLVKGVFTSGPAYLMDEVIRPMHFAYRSKLFRVKPEKQNICQFSKGDICEIDQLVGPNKANVILFRNALYHLIHRSDVLKALTPYDLYYLPKGEMEAKLNALFSKIYYSMADDGLFVLGRGTFITAPYVEDIITAQLKKVGFEIVQKEKVYGKLCPTIVRKPKQSAIKQNKVK